MFKRSLLSVALVVAVAPAFAADSSASNPTLMDSLRDKASQVSTYVSNSTPARFARNQWNNFNETTVGAFMTSMANPARYKQAFNDVWHSNYKEALPTLWQNHKPVLAGTAVVAAAVAGVCAWYKGCFKKASRQES